VHAQTHAQKICFLKEAEDSEGPDKLAMWHSSDGVADIFPELPFALAPAKSAAAAAPLPLPAASGGGGRVAVAVDYRFLWLQDWQWTMQGPLDSVVRALFALVCVGAIVRALLRPSSAPPPPTPTSIPHETLPILSSADLAGAVLFLPTQQLQTIML
jgi:hypothetical protein